MTSFPPFLSSLYTALYTSPCSLLNSQPLFFIDCHYMHICICYVYTPKYKHTLLCVYNVACTDALRVDHLVLDNQSVCSSSGRTAPPTLKIF